MIMNKIYKFFIFLLLSVSLALGLSNLKAKAYSYYDLDHIQLYEIWVNPVKEDGSLNIEFHIVWEVLDSSSDGPLEWIKIGIPNYHATNIEALSGGISKIKYYSEDGSFIRIDFSKKHYQGDVIDIRFKYNQSYMYHLDGDNVVYDYHPGWFDEIKVDECNLYWAKDGVEEIAEGITSGVDFSEDDNY